MQINNTAYKKYICIYLELQQKCEACDKSCKTCQLNPPIDCDKCELNYFRVMNSSKCVINCGDGQFGDLGSKNFYRYYYLFKETGECKLCDSSLCFNCSSFTACTACKENQFLNDIKCVNECPNDTFKDVINRKCITCTNNCR